MEENRSSRVEAAKAMAKAICSSYGPRGCLCNFGASKCHAVVLYQDFAIAALLGAEKAGFMLIRKEEYDALQGGGRNGLVRREDRTHYAESISRITDDGTGAGLGAEESAGENVRT
jgi:hypothetical protein